MDYSYLGPFTLGPNDQQHRNGIYTGDARKLARHIPDESVDLIFTDPVYDRLDDYRWLAETAARVLKPNSACLVWFGSDFLPDVLRHACRHLTYRLIFCSIFPSYPRWMDMVGLKSKRLLWFDKGNLRPYERIYDVQYGTDNSVQYTQDVKTSGGQSPDGKTSWAKGTDVLLRFVSAFTRPGAVVFDPFAGSGSTAAVCKQLGRRYIAFEIDPATAAAARQRVQSTQPPLFVLEPEQMRLAGVA